MDSEAEVHQRRGLAWPYVVCVVVEVGVLATLVALYGAHPPYTYQAGWIAAGLMIGAQVYSLRRHVSGLRSLGSLAAWLDLHIFLGLQGFLLVVYHAIDVAPSSSLATFDITLVAVIVGSGLIGRYIYTAIPLARDKAIVRYAELAEQLGHRAPPPEVRRECRWIRDLVHQRAVRERAIDDAAQRLSPDRMSAFVRCVALAARISRLEVADRWVSRWTLLHAPVAFLLLCFTVLHVLAHYAYAM